MRLDDMRSPPFPEIAGEPWLFGQPAEAGNYEWWSPVHSLDVNQSTIFIGYDGNVNGWGRDVWYRKIPATSVWSYRGRQVYPPFQGAWCNAFIAVIDYDVIYHRQNNLTPGFLTDLDGTSFAAFVKSRLLKPDGSRLIRADVKVGKWSDVSVEDYDETANGS